MKYYWKILVLEDNPIESKYLSIQLKDFIPIENITFCQNFHEAVEAVKTKQFDLIMTDLHMPEKTGMDFIIDVLQEDEKHQNTPIIVTSGTHPDSFLAHTVQSISFDFLFKPFGREELKSVLEKVKSHLDLQE